MEKARKKILVVVLVLTGSHIVCAVVGFVAHEAAVAKNFRKRFEQHLAEVRQDTLKAVSSELDTAKQEWAELARQMREQEAANLEQFQEQLAHTRKEALEAVATELDSVKKEWGELARRIAEGEATSAEKAKESQKLAQQLWHQGKLEAASYCFYNAVAHDPSNIVLVEEYCTNVLSWCAEQIAKGQSEFAWDKLLQLDNFLKNRLPKVEPGDMEKWMALAESTASLQDKIIAQRASAHAAALQDALAQAKQLCAIRLPSTLADADSQLPKLEHVMVVLADHSPGDHPELAEVQSNLQGRLQAVKVKRDFLALDRQFIDLCQDAGERWAGAKGEDDLDLVLYKIRMLDQLAGQMALADQDDTAMARLGDLRSLSQKVATGQDATRLSDLAPRVESVLRKVPSQWAKCEPQILETMGVIESVQEKLFSAESEGNRQKLQGWMKDLNRKLGQLYAEQSKRYQAWAIKQCKDLYNIVNEEDFGPIADNEEGAERHLKQYLGEVNTAFLNSAAATCYQEVWGYILPRLDLDGQRIRVSAEIALQQKKSPSDF